MHMKAVFYFSVCMFFLFSCNDKNNQGDWSEDDQNHFREVISNLFSSYDEQGIFSQQEVDLMCNCALNKAKENYKNLKEAESKLTSNIKGAKSLFENCAREIKGEIFETKYEVKKESTNKEVGEATSNTVSVSIPASNYVSDSTEASSVN